MKIFNIGDFEVRKYNHSENLRTDNRKPHIIAGMILQEGLPKKYDVVSFNCEHFATYCWTGKAYCKQTQTENPKGKKKLDDLVRNVEQKFINSYREKELKDKKAKLEQERAVIDMVEKLYVPNAAFEYGESPKKTEYNRMA